MTAPEALYLIAGTAGIAAVVAAPVLWRWVKDAKDDYPTHPRNKEAFDALNLRAANFRRLREWRNRAANAKAALELELKRKRGGIGQARKNYGDAVAQVLTLEQRAEWDAKIYHDALQASPETLAKWRAMPENSQQQASEADIRRAMLTASVGSDPSDPA